MSHSYRNNNNKRARKRWREPEDKSLWLLELINAGEAAVKGYEKYLLNELNYAEFAKVMMILRELLPMKIDKRYIDFEEEERDDEKNKEE